MADGYARCNFDGKPVSPKDRADLAKLRDWLVMDRDEQIRAAREDPEWREFLDIQPIHPEEDSGNR